MPMEKKPRRRLWRWGLPLAIVLLVVVGALVFDALARWQLEKAANRAAGEDYHVSIGRLRTNIFKGSATVYDLRVWFDTLRTDSLLKGDMTGLLTIQADRIDLEDLSYRALFINRAIRVRKVEVRAPKLGYWYRAGSVKDVIPEDTVKTLVDMPEWIGLDTLVVLEASAKTIDISGKRGVATMRTLDLHAGRMRLIQYDEQHMRLTVASAAIQISEVSVALPPLYDLHIASLRMTHPSGQAEVAGIEVIPRADEHHYGTLVPFETDLFKVSVDSIVLRGLGVARFLADGTVNMRHMRVLRPVMLVYRDKTLRDPPWAHKPLPTRALRDLELPLRIDTVTLQDGRVDYHERDTLSQAYGVVSFNALEGTVTGADSNAPEGKRLEVKAQGRIYERSTVFLTYGADLHHPQDAFSLSAFTTDIPFELFNRMTDNLLHVQASAGKIHRLDLRMTGDDHTGRGTIDLAYEDLRIAIRGSGSGGGRLKNLLANLVVRSHNMPERRGYRQGTLDIERRRDRSLFNFMWNAVKAGTVDTMAPEVARGLAREATGHKEEGPVKSSKNKKKK